ncbi:patatin-like phospholipase family protein [Pedomonas mirosovicensis]|uniref:patatin-like phospholipase family protein n=1 Tax=Pedomonas mirosovicensis TaxID=2908641 RepID=UPI002168233B|nr:patatin-like phospholipase family protein [Pedomonas mirosovicensis]MCH8683811.1 patatin-like phospholipase family protein [Pedomonas mirosovicensis]
MPAPSPTVALALGGGAALGWAHIGIVRTLVERGVHIDAVAGTSIGAVVAACVAADKLDALEDLARSATALTVLRYLDVGFRGSMLGGRTIERQLRRHFGDLRLEDLPLPCATVAADLVSGTEVVLRDGPVVEAVRASLAIPGLFKPVVRNDYMLADGGLVNPVPVSAARQLSACPVIAVNLQGDYINRAAATGFRKAAGNARISAIRTTRASLGLLLSSLARHVLAANPADLVITPAIGHIEVGDFTRAEDLIQAGRRAAEDAWPTIEALNCI